MTDWIEFENCLQLAFSDIVCDYEDFFATVYMNDLSLEPRLVARRLAAIGKGFPRDK